MVAYRPERHLGDESSSEHLWIPTTWKSTGSPSLLLPTRFKRCDFRFSTGNTRL